MKPARHLVFALLVCSLVGCASQKSSGPHIPGVDVSHYQGEVNWPAVSTAGVHFAYIKASEGLRTNDPQFAKNWHDATTAGIKPGAYHFFHPDEDALAQAQHFLRALKTAGIDLRNTLPPVLDIEIAEGANPTTVSNDILIWLEAVEEALACKPVIYTSPNFWDKHDARPHTGYQLWLADYNVEPTLPDGWNNWLFWQHTPKGTVDGIKNPVDLNVFAGSRGELDAVSCH